MESKHTLWKDTAIVAAGQILCACAMVCIFALLGYFDMTVLLGSLAGTLLATGNYLVMHLVAEKAADRAEQQDIAGGQKLIQMSYTGRMIVLLLALILLAKSGWCHVITLALPLAFTRPVLTIRALFFKKGGTEV